MQAASVRALFPTTPPQTTPDAFSATAGGDHTDAHSNDYADAQAGRQNAAFFRVAQLAASLTQTPFALLRLANLAESGDAADFAFPRHRPVFVPGAKSDVPFYAAQPIHDAQGKPIGSLAVWNTTPRPRQGDGCAVQQALLLLAQQAAELLALHQQVGELSSRAADHSRAEEAALWQARHDVLTGLPNRTLFLECTASVLQAAPKRNRKGGAAVTQGVRGAAVTQGVRGAAVLFLDLDRFKPVNDALGHAAGDNLLREVSARFSGCLRPEDTLARLGGDEFAVLLPHVPTPAYAASVAQMLIRSLARPIVLQTEEVHVGVSVGIAAYPHDGGDGETLLKHADIAMYEAKAQGGYQAYSQTMNADGYQKLRDEAALRRAIETGELSLCYQPTVDMQTGEIVSVEALARWRDPERGMVPPAHFIQLAEQADLIVPLGEWVLKQACREAARWRTEGHPDLRVAVNLSARQLSQPSLVDFVKNTLADTDLPGNALDLELTETALCQNGDSSPQTVQALRALGIRLLVDDFGTGYSSLAYLRRFSVDILKIDRAFVAGLGKNTADDALVRAVIEMAHALGLLVIAEGVETEEQSARLKTLGCDRAQGYLWSRPISAYGLKALLAGRGGGYTS